MDKEKIYFTVSNSFSYGSFNVKTENYTGGLGNSLFWLNHLLGPNWVNEYVEGALLALLSGNSLEINFFLPLSNRFVYLLFLWEKRDTVELGPFGIYVL